MAAEMELKYDEFYNLSWHEFDYYATGYQRRLERGWDYARHLIASMFNSSGMSKKRVEPKQVMRLELLDKTKFEKVTDESINRMLNALKTMGDA